MNPKLEVVGRFDVGSTPEDVAMSSTGAMLVAALGDTLTGFETQRGRPSWSVRGNFVACRTFEGGHWAAERFDTEIELSVRDDRTGEVRCATRVIDPFRGSSVMLLPHPSDRSTVAWVAAGQNGQTAYLATRNASAIETTAIPPRDRCPPIFLPDGSSYLSAGDDLLEQYRWPGGERIGIVEWPAPGIEEDGASSGDDVQILPGGFATWSSQEGLIYIIDLETLRTADELTVEGHPVGTAEGMFANNVGIQTPCTDFRYATPGPDGLVLTVHDYTQLVVSAVSDWSPDPTRTTR